MQSIMNQPSPGIRHRFFGNNLYIGLALLASIPIYLTINYYVNTIGVHADETVAFAATAFFLGGIFAGRYISQIWTASLRKMPVGLIIALSLLIVICIIWLFVHADFPLQGRVAINLLLFWIPFAMISVAVGVLIKIIRAITENQVRAAELAAASSKSELHLLQSQLSPHFLFNTLNNLYGLSLTDHEKIPQLLLRLSELLRYSVYEANNIYVPLTNEIDYINNYIAFEKIRIGERLVLEANIEDIRTSEIKIAPMLLIVFIENAFKHSKNTTSDKIYIEISLKTWGSFILFSVKNSYASEKKEGSVTDSNSGFGLASVRQRLDLLYLNEHDLSVRQDDQFYEVMLQIKMR